MKKNVYITEELKAFLLKEKVYKKFMRNSYDTTADEPFESLEQAFTWRRSPEGPVYWEKLSDKWKKQ